MLSCVTFVISAENHPDVPARTVLLLHRLAIHIRVLTMIRPGRSQKMRMTIHVELDASHAMTLATEPENQGAKINTANPSPGSIFD
jgi:hypothetical protein